MGQETCQALHGLRNLHSSHILVSCHSSMLLLCKKQPEGLGSALFLQRAWGTLCAAAAPVAQMPERVWKQRSKRIGAQEKPAVLGSALFLHCVVAALHGPATGLGAGAASGTPQAAGMAFASSDPSISFDTLRTFYVCVLSIMSYPLLSCSSAHFMS